jgi:PAS domain S-box-containing protein
LWLSSALAQTPGESAKPSTPLVALTNAPLVSIRSLLDEGRRWGALAPVRVTGIVTGRLRDGSFFVQEGTNGVRVLGTNSPALEPGTRVEVLGRVSLDFALPVLDFRSVTNLDRAPEPEAPLITEAQAVQTAHAMTLVRMRGRLVDTTVVEGWEWVVRPENGSLSLGVDLARVPDMALLDHVKPGSQVEVQGVLSRRTGPNREILGLHMAVRRASDITVLSKPPFWSAVRAWQGLTLVGLLTGGAFAWRFTLRHEVGKRTQLLQERLNQESAFRQSEARFARMFRSSPDPIVVSGEATEEIVDVNPAFEAVTGYTRADVLGKTTLELELWKNPADRASARSTLRSRGSVSNIPFELRTRDGQWRHCLVSAERIEFNSQACVLALIRDVTDREEQTRAFLRAQRIGQVGTWVYDIQRRAFEASAEACRIVGAPSSTLRMEDLVRKIHPEDAEKVRDDWSRMLAGGAHDLEYRLVVDGEIRWTHVRAEAERDHSGRILRVAGVTQDITDRKVAELAAREGRQHFEALIAASPVGVFRTDAEGACLFVNARWCEIAGMTAEEAAGTGWSRTIADVDREHVAALWAECARKGEPFRMEFRFIRPDGVETWVLSQASIIRDPGGRIVGHIGTVTDITDRRQAQDLLQAREALFRAIAEQTPDSLFLLDIARPENPAQIVYANAAAARMHGTSVAEMVGKSITVFDCASTADRAPERIRRLQRGESLAFRGAHRRSDGSSFPVEVSAQLIPALGPGIVLAIDRDITEQVRSEALAEGQRRILEMIAQAKPVHETLEALMRVLEAHSPELIGSVLLLDPDGSRLRHGAAPSLPDSYNRLIDGIAIGPCVGSCGTAAYRGESVLVADIASDPLWAAFKDIALSHGLHACWSTPFFDEAHRVLGTFAIYSKAPGLPTETHERLIRLATQTAAICITRHRAEADLRQSRERYASLVTSVNGIVWEADPLTAQFLFVSSAAERILGYPASDWLRTDFWQSHVFPEDRDNAIAFCKAEAEAGRDHSFEYRMLAADGRTLWIRDYVSVFMEDGKPALLRGILVDVTEQKRMEEEKQKLEAQLQQAQRLESVGTLAGGIAHDFNNILGAILGNADLATKDVPPNHPARESIDEIRKAGIRGRDLVEQILAFGRGEPRERLSIHLQPIVQEAAQLLRTSLPPEVRIVTRFHPQCPGVMADAAQMHQVVMNLGTNAAQAMEGRSGSIHITLDPFVVDESLAARTPGLRPGPHVRLAVQDEGCGMDSTTLGRMFDPFFTTKGVGKGTGLGLPVVHGIVARHLGGIAVSSQPGQGALFEIYLPKAAVAPSETAPQPPASNTSFHAGHGRRLLMIDDEDALVRYQSRLLERLGFHVSGFTSPTAALAAFRADPSAFDALLTDLNLPGISGLDILAEVLRIRPGFPVILLSGLVTEELNAAASARGAGAVIMKPGTSEELVATLHRLLEPPPTIDPL